jgi:hypothetical protein
MMMLTKTFRTKAEAKDALKAGELLQIQNESGKVFDRMNGGPIDITGKLAHYKEWRAEVILENGRVTRLK